MDAKTKKPVEPAHGTATLTLTISGTAYALWKVPPDKPDVTVCYELKKRGSAARYHVSQHEHGCECTCGDWTFRRNHLDPNGCKHIKSLALFGLIENHPAPLRDRPMAPPRPISPPTARGMTRSAIESGAAVHPFEVLGVGPAPYQLVAGIHLPQAPSARRSAVADNAERLYRVKSGFCYACKCRSDETFVVERADRKNGAVCRACIHKSQDGGLIRRLAHLDHEAERLARQGDRDRGRTGR